MDPQHVTVGERLVTIRQIRPDDGARLQRSHARLSPQSRYRRFMGAKPELSRADARYLVDVDGVDHCALVAVDADEIIAVARFIRLAGQPDAAEFAIVVGDACQRRGLGTTLLRRLGEVARARGITRFTATVLTANAGIQRLAARVAAGGAVQRRPLGDVCEIEFALPAPVPPAKIAA